MAFSLIVTTGQGLGAANGGTTGSAIDTTGANLLVMAVSTYSTGAISISDSKGNTYSTIDTATATSGGDDTRLGLYYVNNTSPNVGSGHTFTVTGTGVYPSVFVQAWSGLWVAGSSNKASTTNTSQLGTGNVFVDTGSLVIVGLSTIGVLTSTLTGNPEAMTIADTVVTNATDEGGSHGYRVITTATGIQSAIWDQSPSTSLKATVIVSFGVPVGGTTWPGYQSPFGWQ